MNISRIIISGLSGGSGKTLLSLGLCRALVHKGLNVKPFKKGPDYIDAHWLSFAANNHCTNLDPYFLDASSLQALFEHSINEKKFSIAVIEGNRGLFDGQDIHGTCSSAELARILNTPVILSLNITKMTRTAAAIIAGLASFEKDLHIAGVVLSQVGSARHEGIVRKSIEHYTGIPVLGAIPRLEHNPLPERHMGLYDAKAEATHATLDNLANLIEMHCDIENIIDVANSAPKLEPTKPFWPEQINQPKVRIGYIFDAALWFYYAENLDALKRAGAELIPLSILDNKEWPDDLGGIYLGGGYPEEFLDSISSSPHLEKLRIYSENFMPIYAECGGFMILSAGIVRNNVCYKMAEIFPTRVQFHHKPQGLGYVRAKVKNKNPYHPQNLELRGHEFHYSCCLPSFDEQNISIQDLNSKDSLETLLCFELQKGMGMGKSQDGLCIRNTFASYTHIYAPICPWWAKNFVQLANTWQNKNL